MIEAAFGMRPQGFQRRGAISIFRAALGLKGVDSDLLGLMQVPPGHFRWSFELAYDRNDRCREKVPEVSTLSVDPRTRTAYTAGLDVFARNA